VGCFPSVGVTGRAVPTDREGFANRAADQTAVCCAVAVRAVIQVCRRGRTGQGIFVTAGTVVGAGGCHQSAVIRSSGMDDTPHAAMTGRAVASGSEILLIGAVSGHQGTIAGVTGHTTSMGLQCDTVKGVVMTAGTAGRGYLYQCAVVRSTGGVGCFPSVGVTGRAVPTDREGFANRAADQTAVCCAVAVRAVIKVCRRGRTGQGILVTAGTVVGAGGCHQSAVIRSCGMDATPHAAMTGRAVASGSEVLTDRSADQRTVSIVTAGAVIVNLRVGCVSERRRIAVTARTTASTDLHQGVVARNIGGVGHDPTVSVTGRAVSAGGKIFANRQTNQGTGSGVMTAGAIKVGLNSNQRVVVAGGAGRTINRHQSGMVRYGRVKGIPGVGVTDGTITTSREVLPDRQTDQAAVGSVTTAAIVMGIGSGAGQGVVVTIRASATAHLDQGNVVRSIAAVGHIPTA